MGVQVSNRSCYPNSMMKLFAETAYKLSGCRGDVIVHVGNGSKNSNYSGLFIHTERIEISDKYYPTHGFVKVSPTISLAYTGCDALRHAEKNFKVFLHEFHHCREYQDMKDFGVNLEWDRLSENRFRRGTHRNRPQEIRANQAEEDYYAAAAALPEWGKIQEKILEFALILERNTK